jgi:hypothetical protein
MTPAGDQMRRWVPHLVSPNVRKSLCLFLLVLDFVPHLSSLFRPDLWLSRSTSEKRRPISFALRPLALSVRFGRDPRWLGGLGLTPVHIGLVARGYRAPGAAQGEHGVTAGSLG